MMNTRGTKRQTSESANDGNDKNPKKIKPAEDWADLLECPVCYEYPTPYAPVPSCRLGHIFCNHCKPKLKTCPVCRHDDIDCENVMARTILRWHLYNKEVACKWPCQTNWPLKSLRLHEDLCQHRKVACCQSQCKWTGSLLELFTHWEQENTKCARSYKDAHHPDKYVGQGKP